MVTNKVDLMLQQIIAGTVRNVTNAYLIDCQSRQFSKHTIILYSKELRIFSEYLDSVGVIQLLELTPDVIRRHLLALSQRRNPGGVHIAYRVIKAFLRWAWEELEIESRNPITRVEAPKYIPHPLPGVSIEDIHKLIDACHTEQSLRDKAIFMCLLDTGARASEFVALSISDVDLLTGKVIILHGKGDKWRIVYLGKKSLKALRAYLKTQGKLSKDSPLWMTSEGERLTYSGLREIIRRRSRMAGLEEEPGVHDFRRAFALSMLRNGCDLVTLAQLMGHSPKSGLEVLRRYLALVEGDLAEAHRRNSPVDHSSL